MASNIGQFITKTLSKLSCLDKHHLATLEPFLHLAAYILYILQTHSYKFLGLLCNMRCHTHSFLVLS